MTLARTYSHEEQKYYEGKLRTITNPKMNCIQMDNNKLILCDVFDILVAQIEDGRKLYENDICLMLLDGVIKEVVIKLGETGRIEAIDKCEDGDYVLSVNDIEAAINGICGTVINGKKHINQNLHDALLIKLKEQFLKGKKPIMPSSLRRLLDQIKFESGKTIEIFEGPYTTKTDAIKDYQILRDVILGYARVIYSLSIGISPEIEDDRRVFYIKGKIEFIEINWSIPS